MVAPCLPEKPASEHWFLRKSDCEEPAKRLAPGASKPNARMCHSVFTAHPDLNPNKPDLDEPRGKDEPGRNPCCPIVMDAAIQDLFPARHTYFSSSPLYEKKARYLKRILLVNGTASVMFIMPPSVRQATIVPLGRKVILCQSVMDSMYVL